MRKDGFYTALGTPLDDQGKVVKQSFVKQIEDQIASGASGLLVMGTMGALGTIRNSAYEEMIVCACDAISDKQTQNNLSHDDEPVQDQKHQRHQERRFGIDQAIA